MGLAIRAAMVASGGAVASDVNHGSRTAAGSASAGSLSSSRWIGSHVELVLGELDDIGEDGVMGSGLLARAGLLGLVGQGHLVAVMAVGHDHGRGGDRLGDGGHHARLGHPPQAMVDPVGAGAGQGRLGHVAQIGEAGRHRQAPDGREVGAGGPEQIEAVLLVLGRGAFVGEDVDPGGSKPSAPSTPVVWRGLPASSWNPIR